MSDLVTSYGPQATTSFTCFVLVPFEHEPSKSECLETKKKKEFGNDNRNICVTCISNPANGAKISFETYNQIMGVLLHNFIECL